MVAIHRERPGASDLAAATGDRATSLGDDIWMSEGVSNAYAITTDAGRVMINTGLVFEAPMRKQSFEHLAGPTPAIFVTQGHADHWGGVSCLLDQDAQRRSLLHWECMNPVPPATPETHRTDPRCLAMLEGQASILKFVQEAKMPLPHWEDADGPTEDMFHTQDFKGLAWDAYIPSSSYSKWLFEEADLTSTYRYQRQYLQVLQSTVPGTWSLKMPSHSVFLDTLLNVFPDARLIWAHRDPYKAAGSLANLHMLPKSTVQHAHVIDREALGRNVKAQMKEHVERPLRTRDRIGDDRFFHMYYSEMMRDPMGVMRRIYDWAGDDFAVGTENRMRSWLSNHPQTRFGLNNYSLDQYGLSVAELKPVFAEYLSEFDIELESSNA